MSQSITTIFGLFEGAAIFTRATEHAMNEKMVSNIAAWAGVPEGETVIAVTPTDMMLGGKKGMAIGAKGIYWKNGIIHPEMSLTWEQLAQTTDSLIANPKKKILELVGGKFYDMTNPLITNTALKDLLTRLAQHWGQAPDQFTDEAVAFGLTVPATTKTEKSDVQVTDTKADNEVKVIPKHRIIIAFVIALLFLISIVYDQYDEGEQRSNTVPISQSKPKAAPPKLIKPAQVQKFSTVAELYKSINYNFNTEDGTLTIHQDNSISAALTVKWVNAIGTPAEYLKEDVQFALIQAVYTVFIHTDVQTVQVTSSLLDMNSQSDMLPELSESVSVSRQTALSAIRDLGVATSFDQLLEHVCHGTYCTDQQSKKFDRISYNDFKPGRTKMFNYLKARNTKKPTPKPAKIIRPLVPKKFSTAYELYKKINYRFRTDNGSLIIHQDSGDLISITVKHIVSMGTLSNSLEEDIQRELIIAIYSLFLHTDTETVSVASSLLDSNNKDIRPDLTQTMTVSRDTALDAIWSLGVSTSFDQLLEQHCYGEKCTPHFSKKFESIMYDDYKPGRTKVFNYLKARSSTQKGV